MVVITTTTCTGGSYNAQYIVKTSQKLSVIIQELNPHSVILYNVTFLINL